MAHRICVIVWLMILLKDLGIKIKLFINLYHDNKVATINTHNLELI